MIKNDLSRYGRILLSFAMLFVVLLLSGCCDFCNREAEVIETDPCTAAAECDDCVCGKDIVYAFNTPETEADCPSGMELRSGGAGVVERDGGAGVVERDGTPVISYCIEACPPGEVESEGAPEIDWTAESDVVVAISDCLPTD